MANPNPRTENLKKFKPGQSGNPGGKTAAQRQLEVENAELAAAAKNRFLRALTAKLAEQSTEEVIAGFDPADLLRLIKDAEDRAHGTPKQSIDNTSSDGTMTPPREIVLRPYKPGDE